MFLCPGILSTTPAGKCYCLHTTSWLAFYPLAVCFNPSATLNAHPKLPGKKKKICLQPFKAVEVLSFVNTKVATARISA
jgi:hypothetical protein